MDTESRGYENQMNIPDLLRLHRMSRLMPLMVKHSP